MVSAEIAQAGEGGLGIRRFNCEGGKVESGWKEGRGRGGLDLMVSVVGVDGTSGIW